MIHKIIHTPTQEILFPHVSIPKNYFRRAFGLMGRKALDEGCALMITRCRSIHTHFMRFTIDAIFVDKDLKIQSIHKNIKPWSFVFAGSGAHSVLEFTSHHFDYKKIKIGDQLSVDS